MMQDYFEVITNAQTGEQTVRPYTASEIAAMQPSIADLSAGARTKRNSLLAASDWTQVIDAPVDQAAWAIYRQELRDISRQSGFPANVNWPVSPE